MTRSKILLIGIITLMLASCINQNQTSQTNTDTEVSYKMEHFADISPYFAGDSIQIDTTKFSATYPDFSESWINQLITDELFGGAEFHHMAESFLTGYTEYAEDESMQKIHAWFENIDLKVNYQTPEFLSLLLLKSDYTGGAHSQYYYEFLNIDLTDKKVLKLEDLIQSAKMTDFQKSAEAIFRKNENISEDASLAEDYFFEDAQFSLPVNFGIERDSLVFIYNPYAIKPWSEGITTLKIPYNQIEQWMTEKGKAVSNQD